ncbi:MAG: DNA primase [Verrucomicrobia bacterium]|nr:DNA primase [Verrucomicrobiota bacterium]
MPRIAPETIEQVAAASDIIEIINSYFPLKRAGTEHRALCPFHQEKTPSFYVNPAKQSFYCFGCGAGGTVFQFIMQYENVEFVEAVRRLASRASIALVEQDLDLEDESKQKKRKRLLRLHFEAAAWFHRNLLRTRAAEHAREYLRTRGINIETAKKWQLGYAPNEWTALTDWARKSGFSHEELVDSGLVKLREENDRNSIPYDRFRDRLIFPISNDIGEVIAFSGRVLRVDSAGGKYVNSPETALFTKGSVLYGLDKAKRAIAKSQTAVILEGQIDLIMAFEAGIQNVVAPQGTALTERHGNLLRRFAEQAILFFDSDSAGQKAAERAYQTLLSAGMQVRVGELPPGDDPDSLIRFSGIDTFRSLIDKADDFFEFQIRRNLNGTESATTAGRVAFARKVIPFITVIPDRVLQEAVLSRVATRLTLPRETLEGMVQRQRSAAKQSAAVSPSAVNVRHDFAVICKAALTDPLFLKKIRTYPWQRILDGLEGSQLLRKILASELEPDRPPSLASFFSCLEEPEAAIVSRILANKELNEAVGEEFWINLCTAEIQRRKNWLLHIQRLASDDIVAYEHTSSEIKEVLDLETAFTDILRLSCRQRV